MLLFGFIKCTCLSKYILRLGMVWVIIEFAFGLLVTCCDVIFNIFLSYQGSVDAKGTYQELMLSGKDFAKLLSSSHDENNPEAEKPPPMSRRTSARVRLHEF